jgi:phosphodiesterase/alkaline phosphatase D-like protein
MRTFVLTFVFAGAIACPALLDFPAARAMAAAQGTESARLTAGPELEMASETTAIIRWTTTNPGGTTLHFGIVHYGTDPANLKQLAKSPNRRNPSHPDMIFRVRIAGLNPATTYYYTIESTGSIGVSDGVSVPVTTFKTR